MFIPPEHIVPELEGTERYSVFRELIRRLIQVGAILPQIEDSLSREFQLREETLTTGVGFGNAFPHIVTDAVTKQLTAMGHSKMGVDFKSTDGKVRYNRNFDDFAEA